ncbi:hypothetical protein [Luteimonas suaedae]|uniref:hypothetical protein n=1 Tax=Luteimonas suaedae TaxID=2605430 RepID=UPI0011EE42B3|nr:hypothetical protein [Luteimonas suaedae]
MCAASFHPPTCDTAGVASESVSTDVPSTRTTLQRLVHTLLGGAMPASADAAIARLPATELEALARDAQEESETCLERAELLLSLAEAGLEHGAPCATGDMLRISRHVARLLQDHRRWRGLAGNAAYYHDHPDIAARTAAAWRKSR